MDIPENIKLRNTMHGHGDKGMAFYGYEDMGGLGVRMEARRENSRSPFVEKWFLDALPDREFPSFKALREAALPLSDAEIEAQTSGLYPLIREIEPDSCGNHCRLCSRPPYVPSQERQRYDTWRVTIAYSWKDLHSMSLCDEHVERFEQDPKGLKAAIEEEVRQRMERAKQNNLLAALKRNCTGEQTGG